MSSASASDPSAYIDPPHPDLQEQGPSRVYHVYKDFLSRHYEIKGPDDEFLFYADFSLFAPNKPDLTLHAGTSTQAPIVAVSNFLKFSGHFKLGLGNPEDINHVQWEDMTKQDFRGLKYRFEMNIPDAPGSPETPGQRRSFLWERTHQVGVEDLTPSKWNARNFKLVDERTGQLLAVFTAEKPLSKCGRLQINVDQGENFETMVIISYMSLYEKFRRRNRQGGAGGGGA